MVKMRTMQWSKIKSRMEATFADKARGRVEIFATRYRLAHDAAGECWITIDGERIACMAEISYWKHRLTLEREMARDGGDRGRIFFDAEAATRAAEVYSDGAFKDALIGYLDLSIDDILATDNPIMRAFAMLDRRFGKRRLTAFDPAGETALLRRLYEFRCEIEGVAPQPSIAEADINR